MGEPNLLTVLKQETQCSDCTIGNASGGPSRCNFLTKDFAEDEALFKESDRADCVWFIKSGVVTLGHELDEAASVVLRDNLIGVDCLVSPTRLRRATAVTEVRACSMSKTALLEWLGANKERLRIVIDAAMSDPTVTAIIDRM